MINITIPVYNEEAQLVDSVRRVAAFLALHQPGPVEIVIADNASTDQTLRLASKLAEEHPQVRVVHLDQKGRGRALRRVWMESTAAILSYMDVDLSTDLAFFPALIEPLIAGRSDLSVGSRLRKESQTRRGLKREFLSRGYNWLVKAALHTRFSDAQCGFKPKAITRRAALDLLPQVEDEAWFFDTELLALAEWRGYRLFNLPVRWTDDPDSRVRICRTAWEDIKGLIHLRRRFARERKGALVIPARPGSPRQTSNGRLPVE